MSQLLHLGLAGGWNMVCGFHYWFIYSMLFSFPIAVSYSGSLQGEKWDIKYLNKSNTITNIYARDSPSPFIQLVKEMLLECNSMPPNIWFLITAESDAPEEGFVTSSRLLQGVAFPGRQLNSCHSVCRYYTRLWHSCQIEPFHANRTGVNIQSCSYQW